MIDARDVSAGYLKNDAVIRDITLTLDAGRITCLVGPNGAGKSTLLSVLAGIVPPATGTVAFNGTPIATLSRKIRARRIGYLPQIVRPSIPYSVYELVSLGRYAHGSGWSFETEADRDAVMRALEKTRADHLVDRRFSELSGGERQRVLIASVLSAEPDAILLDEPTASLDIGRSTAVFETLESLVGDGAAVGVVTHDLNLAGQFADAIGLMADGRLTRIGAPEAVLTEGTLRAAYGDGFVLVQRPDSAVPAVLPAGRQR